MVKVEILKPIFWDGKKRNKGDTLSYEKLTLPTRLQINKQNMRVV
mgnify:CR=1 FL=1|jgi:hypothetical protein|tara:strand:+ start:1468 stop:1602 length:135 start_codon:yes stop_codon:yes gene_type:complete